MINAVLVNEGVMSRKYTGSDFCKGLIFGSVGSNLVLTMGKNILNTFGTVDLFKVTTLPSGKTIKEAAKEQKKNK